jgi:hypothetical protein
MAWSAARWSASKCALMTLENSLVRLLSSVTPTSRRPSLWIEYSEGPLKRAVSS